MTGADILAIAIGVLCGILAGVPTALLLLVIETRLIRHRPQPPVETTYRQFHVIEGKLLGEGHE